MFLLPSLENKAKATLRGGWARESTKRKKRRLGGW